MDGGRDRPKAQAAAAQISAAALDKRLHIRRRAQADAAQDLPRMDATQLSATEQAILDTVALERAQIDLSIAALSAETERRLRALAPTPQDFTSPVLEARLTIKQTEGRISQDWAEAAARRRQARADLHGFKEAHELKRLAIYPESGLLQAGLLLTTALFEAVFSAALFAEDDARGLLGGAVTAIGLSGANVTLGFLAGFLGLRYLQHVRPGIKTLGGLGSALLLALAFYLNFFAANWRDALTGAGDLSSALPAWLEFLSVETPQAVILLMLGGGVWVFAALKGYSGFDDPYPDYGKIDRAEREACAAMAEFRDDARTELEAPINTARTALAARLEKTRAESEAMSKTFDAAAIEIEDLSAQARRLDQAASAAIQTYREENTARRISATPAYFDAGPPLPAPPDDALAQCAQMIANARVLVQDAQDQSAHALATLLEDLDAAQTRLEAAHPE
jgi:hypothetical protein